MAVSEAVKERPILFSGDMVRAIMAGRKTQTRRVVKYHEPSFWEHGSATNERSWHPTVVDRGVLWSDGDGHGFTTPIRCPYGKVGDTLWVRETWDHGTCPGDLHGMAGYAADVPVNWRDYRMHPDAPAGSENWCREWKRRPSIHMPRWASRLTLEVTEVRVQRLQEISDEDCKAEGIDDAWLVKAHIPSDGRAYCFRHLWDDINGKKHPWESNPWVWAISFRVKHSVLLLSSGVEWRVASGRQSCNLRNVRLRNIGVRCAQHRPCALDSRSTATKGPPQWLRAATH